MGRGGKHLFGPALLDDAAQIHHQHTVAETAHDQQVMADEQHRQAKLGPQIREEPDDLRLDRDVQRGDRFIGDQEVGRGRQGPGNANPLALAAREFVREARGMRRIEPHLNQQRREPGGAATRVAHGVDRQSVGDLGTHPPPWVQAAEGILKHDLHPPAHRLPLGVRGIRHRLAIESHRAAAGRHQPQQQPA